MRILKSLRSRSITLLLLISVLVFAIMSQAKSTTPYILFLRGQTDDVAINEDTMQQFKDLITSLSGKITHQYDIIPGVSFEISDDFASALKARLDTLGKTLDLHVTMEKDQEVHFFAGKH